MTTLDVLLQPNLVSDAWDYFRNVQTKDEKYRPFLTKDDRPATYVNAKVMADPRLEKELPFDGKRLIFGGFEMWLKM